MPRAIPRPIPVPPPVTRTTLSCKMPSAKMRMTLPGYLNKAYRGYETKTSKCVECVSRVGKLKTGGGRLTVTWTRPRRLYSRFNPFQGSHCFEMPHGSAVTYSSSPSRRHHSRLSEELVGLTGSPHLLWPTLPEICAISSTFTSDTFQMSRVLLAELVFGASAISNTIPSHLAINNRLFDNTALYFFIVSVMDFILQPSAHLASSV